MALSGSVGGTRGSSFSETSGSAATTRGRSEKKKAMAAINELQGFIGGMMKQNIQFTKAIKGLKPSMRRISILEQSRSDCVMVAVGFSPRDNGRERLRVAERRLNRRANRALHASLRDARFLRSLPVGSSPRLTAWPRSAKQNRLCPSAQQVRCGAPTL